MKRIYSLMLFVCLCTIGFAQKNKLKDGLYLVDKQLADTNAIVPDSGQAFVHFNPGFLENAPTGTSGLIIHTSDFVPLELKEALLLPQSGNKKKLELTFSKPASDKLGQFTTAHLMHQVAMIVNGEALTVNKIRDTIRNGKMEITRDDDNVCEHIYVMLKDRIKK